MIISIDGPAGAGKSTMAKQLAKRLQITYLDTGAMYRAVTLKALTQQVDVRDEEALTAMAQQTVVRVFPADEGMRVILDEEDVTTRIRSDQVTQNSSLVASHPKVRDIVVGWQREIGQQQSIVIEGRDIGTVVFPRADVKFFMDANLDERVRRRAEELRQAGQAVDGTALTADLQERDRRDQQRAVGPLCKADDAIAINTTDMSIAQVVDHMLEIVRRKA